MNAIPVVLIYALITFTEIILLMKRKARREVIVYIMVMLIALILSINIAVGIYMPSIASILDKLFSSILT